MESTEELQQLEITALRSIYAEEFIDAPPPKVWKVRTSFNSFVLYCPLSCCQDAARLPEFLIRVPHSDPNYASKIYFHLHTKWDPERLARTFVVDFFLKSRFPKTYPTIACPTFTIRDPSKGLTNDQITKLTLAVRAEAQKYRGSEMVFQVRYRSRTCVG